MNKIILHRKFDAFKFIPLEDIFRSFWSLNKISFDTPLNRAENR